MSAVVLAWALLGPAACRSPASARQQLTSSNPLDQVTAAVALAEARDPQAIHRLVALLEDRDRAVRMYAILALERLCGQTYGYKYYEAEASRAAAVRRWQNALRGGRVALLPDGGADATAAGGDAYGSAASDGKDHE